MTIRVIAEAGMCANSVDWAHRAVVAAADAAVWGFKVQLLNADTLTSRTAERYDHLAGPATQHDAFQNALPYPAWAEIYDHARSLGLEPFASCWDEAAVEASETLLNPAWYKVGSADITHHGLLEVIASTGKRVILSTGAADDSEIGRAVEVLAAAPQLVLMHCPLVYPAGLRDIRLRRIKWLFPFGGDLGFSDHTPWVFTAGLAVAAGADWLEKHFTVTPGRGGDHDFALNPADMTMYRREADRAWQARESWGAELSEPLPTERAARDLARRSLFAAVRIPRGERVVPGVNAVFLRPARGGIPADAKGPWYAERDYQPGEQI